MELRSEYPATSCEMTAPLKTVLNEGDLHLIMVNMGHPTHAHRMERADSETGLEEKSPYKLLRAGASPGFNHVLRVLGSLGVRLQAVPLSDEGQRKAVGGSP